MPDKHSRAVARSQAIRTRLILAFLFITILPLVVVGIVTVTGTLAQRDQIYSQLTIVTHAKRAEIRAWVESQQAALQQMITGENETNWVSDILRDPRQARFMPVYALLLDVLSDRVRLSQLDTVFIADPNGRVVFSTDPALLDQNVANELFFSGGKTAPFASAAHVQDVPEVIFAQPIQDADGNLMGVVSGQAAVSKLTPIMQDATGLGETGDSYLVDKNHIALLPSRYVALGASVYNAATVAALTNYNETAQNTYVNPAGISVLGVSEWVPELQTALVSERSLAEATQAGNATRAVNLSIAISAVWIALYASLSMSRSIGQPLSELADTVSQIAKGNLELAAEVEREDEVAVVAQAVNSMTAQLRDMIGSLESRVELRTAQVRASADVGRAITSILDTELLLNTIVNVVTERFGFYYTAIFTLDQAGTYLVLREATGEAGRLLKERGHRLRVGLDSMVGYAAMKRVPRVALNAGEDAVRFANPLLPETQSEIALPLMVGDQVLGALDVQATQLNAFDETVIATLQNVAAQIAIALQNATSYQRQQQALDFATRQYELSRTIMEAATPTEAYAALGQIFAMLSGVDRISMFRVADWDAIGQPAEYELATEWDVLGGAQFDTGLRYRAAETPFTQLIKPDEIVIISDATDTRLALDIREHLAQVGAQSILLAPLQVRGQYAGFIAAAAEQPHDYQDHEVRLVRSAAEQLGVVLSNLQLTSEMQATLDRVALLNRRLSGEAWGSYLSNRERWVVESGQTLLAPVVSELHVPIVVRGETIGTFDVVDARTDRQWHEDELTMLQTIAGEVALAIENARLIEQTQRTAQREKDIASAADKIHRAINLDAMLQTAVEEVMRIAGTTDVAIQLGRPDAARQ
jgi:GAF domain-containing protein/HAMP domain-containing protein